MGGCARQGRRACDHVSACMCFFFFSSRRRHTRFDCDWSSDVCSSDLPLASVCVVMASGGYPGSYAKGKPIHGLDGAARLPNVKVFHAGTARAGEQIVTSGGRVLGVTAWAKDLRAAQSAAYAVVEQIKFEGAHFRRDIAAKALG